MRTALLTSQLPASWKPKYNADISILQTLKMRFFSAQAGEYPPVPAELLRSQTVCLRTEAR